VFFDHDKGKTHSSGKLLFAARVIPYRGSWLDFEFDAKDIIHVRIDRRRKLPATTLLYALGLDQEGILDYFYTKVAFRASRDGGWTTPVEPTWMRNAKPNNEWVNPKTGEVLAEPGQKITVRALRKWQEEGVKAIAMPDDELVGRYSALDMVNVETGEIYVEAGDELTLDSIGVLARGGLRRDRHDQRRSHQYRRLHPQHHGGGQEPLQRTGADRHLSRDASLASRRRRKPPRLCSGNCSSTPSATTCPASAGSR
jgi:DNA-directed RNA polymerase subunit beta